MIRQGSFPNMKMPVSLIIVAVLGISPFLSLLAWAETGNHNEQRILEVTFLTITIIFYICKLRGGKLINCMPSKELLFCVLIFFLLGFFSSILAYSPHHAFFEWSSFFVLFLAAWLIACEVEHVNGGLKVIFVGCGFICTLYLFHSALVYLFFLILHVEPTPIDLIFGFDNYRFFNHTQTINMSFLGLLVASSKRWGKQYWLWCAITSLWWMLLFVSGGRGTFIGVLMGILISLLFRRARAFHWCRIMLLTCLGGFVLYLLCCVLLPKWLGLPALGLSSEVVERTIVNPVSGRSQLWEFALGMISQHPWLGGGPLHFAHYASAMQAGAHPHNWILQIGAEWGMPALFCLIAAILISYRQLLRLGLAIEVSDSENQTVLCAWLTIGASILIDGMVSGLLVMPTSQLWIALYLGCAWGWTAKISKANETLFALPVRYRSFIILGLALSLLLLWRGLFPEIQDLKSYEEVAKKSSVYTSRVFWPRIWRAGYF
jgi:O-antigen ligase